MATVRLRAGHVQPVWAGHPWVFAQAIERLDGAPAPGDTVQVVDGRGQFLGQGYWSPHSAIPVRILSHDASETLDSAWLGRRIERAAMWRKSLMSLPSDQTNGYRLVHAEGDSLAGLIVDVYGRVAAVQILTIGMKNREQDIFAHVARVANVDTLFEIASPRMQRLEGFEVTTGAVRGPSVDALEFCERGFAYAIELSVAQKTGFYCDQRSNRDTVERLAHGRRVLDAFSYVGAFAFAAARGGAKSVLAMDSSAPAIATGAALAHRFGFESVVQFTRGDAKRALSEMAQKGERYDMVIVDPPKLAPTSKHLEAGRKAYRRINASAMRLLTAGGILVTCSCSGAMQLGDFLRTISFAARDVGREITVLHLGEQGPDHPTPPAFPEGRYLKCAVVLVQS